MVLSLWLKLPRHEAKHSPPPCAKVNTFMLELNAWSNCQVMRKLSGRPFFACYWWKLQMTGFLIFSIQPFKCLASAVTGERFVLSTKCSTFSLSDKKNVHLTGQLHSIYPVKATCTMHINCDQLSVWNDWCVEWLMCGTIPLFFHSSSRCEN
jgi:hypothetical protein